MKHSWPWRNRDCPNGWRWEHLIGLVMIHTLGKFLVDHNPPLFRSWLRQTRFQNSSFYITLFRRRSSSSNSFIALPHLCVTVTFFLQYHEPRSFKTLFSDSVRRIKVRNSLVRCYASQNTFFQNIPTHASFHQTTTFTNTVISLTADTPHCFASDVSI